MAILPKLVTNPRCLLEISKALAGVVYPVEVDSIYKFFVALRP